MGALHRQLGRVVGLDVRECSYECTNKRLARRQGVNDQPNGRSKHDPRQSSHNRDPLEKKIFFFSSIGEWKRRSRPPSRGGIGRRAGEWGSHRARLCPSVSPGFPPSSPGGRPCEAGNRDPPCPSCAGYGKWGLP